MVALGQLTSLSLFRQVHGCALLVVVLVDLLWLSLGGTHQPKEKALDALLITSNLVSVRKNVGGVPVRVFVNLQQNKVRRFDKIRAFQRKSQQKKKIMNIPMVKILSH